MAVGSDVAPSSASAGGASATCGRSAARAAACDVVRAARSGEDRLVVVVLVVEELGSARGEIAAKRVLTGDDERLVVLVAVTTRGVGAGLCFDLERVDVGALTVVVVAALGVGSCAVGGCAALLLALGRPLGERENARLHADDGVRLVFLLQERREPGTHGDLRALADVGEKVLLDGELGDLLVVERLACHAQHFGCGFGERHLFVACLEVPASPAVSRVNRGELAV